MAGKADIEAGSAFIRLFLKNDIKTGLANAMQHVRQTIEKAASGMKKIGETTEQLSGAFTALGTAIVGPLGALAARNEEIRKKLDAIWDRLSKPIAKALMPLVDAFARIAESVADWLERNQQLVRTVFQVGLGFLAAAAAFKIIAASSKILAMALQGAALLISPGGLIVLGAAALAAWLAHATGLAKDLKTQLGAIGEALAAGDLTTAWEIIIETMKLTWNKFTAEIAHTLRNAFTPDWLLDALSMAGVSDEFIQSLRDTIADMRAEGEREIAAIQKRLMELRAGIVKQPDDQGSLNKPFSTRASSAFSAGGAVALSFGGSQSVANQTLAEIRKGNKERAEMLRIMREINARRERPGIFK